MHLFLEILEKISFADYHRAAGMGVSADDVCCFQPWNPAESVGIPGGSCLPGLGESALKTTMQNAMQ